LDAVVGATASNPIIGVRCAYRCTLNLSYERPIEWFLPYHGMNLPQRIAMKLSPAHRSRHNQYDTNISCAYASIQQLETPVIFWFLLHAVHL
jgi:hypothetical protein